MKAEMMMDDLPMILESKPAAALPPDFEIKLPSIIHELPSLLRKPTIIIGDKIPIFHGSSIIIRDTPPAMAADAPKAPEPAMMPAPAAMMPAPEPAMPEPKPMMVPPAPAPAAPAAAPEPPMAMTCSKPPPLYGPWAEQTLSLPPEFFMTDESNHLSGG